MNKIRTLIADDHAVVRVGLAALLESDPAIEVVGNACDGEEAIRQAHALTPDIIVMDIMMPGTDGIEATREIKRMHPEIKILVLTTSTVSDELAAILEAGADGATTKSAANEQLIDAIHAVFSGQRWVSEEITDVISNDPPAAKLTNRQKEILAAIVRGLSNADIALQLGIRKDSVKEHLYAIFAKIGAANRAEAVGIALRKHLLKM